MNKEQLIGLTNTLYKLTLLFPKKEPLRYKMREIADEILAKCLTPEIEHNPKVLNNLEVLDGFFEVVKVQNWVRQEQVLEVQKGYDNIRSEVNRIKLEKQLAQGNLAIEEKSITVEVKPLQGLRMPERQEKILAFLREQGRAQVWQLKEILPEVTKRTLRRDFEALLKQGLIERIGERNNTFYQLKITEK